MTVEDLKLSDIARVFDPARLSQARRLARMTKTDLHNAVGVSAAAIGQYERGEVKPRAETIAALAEALQVPPGFFALGRPRASVEVAEASFRRLRATSVAQQQQAAAYVEHVWELAQYLEESVEFPELDLPDWAMPESTDVPDPLTAARLLREHWGLGTEPIVDLIEKLENYGILVVLFSMKETADEKSRIDAFSTTTLDRPVIVMTPDKADDVLRHRFSAAHELAHVVLHHGRLGTDSEMERDADKFAAEFLTPERVIATELPRRMNFERLESVSQRWGVSVHSLLYRMRELELVSDSTHRRAWITLHSIPRRAQSIWDFPGEQPELLKNALEVLDEEAGVPLSAVAGDLQMTPKRVRQLVGIDVPGPKLSLVRDSDVRPLQAAPLAGSERESEEEGG